ncbi:GNAT family N-acetyltransferase, partial [Arthrobacter sp. H14]|uniref:GNAT family N-acetyltransferase n=1 Tax=Arthrobacter sp. H14 TaxID=1312959 RepID=UPI0009DE28EF
VLHTGRLRLEQLGPQHFDSTWQYLQDEEGRRLTGTHQDFTEDAVRKFLARLPGSDERADWAVIRTEDGAHIGEVVLNDLDEDNRSMNFRIGLAGDGVRGQGYGTEATRAVVAYAFDVVGLHRVSLGVYSFNPRAQWVYEKVGFVREGVARDALLWDGQWHDEVLMAMLTTDARL